MVSSSVTLIPVSLRETSHRFALITLTAIVRDNTKPCLFDRVYRVLTVRTCAVPESLPIFSPYTKDRCVWLAREPKLRHASESNVSKKCKKNPETMTMTIVPHYCVPQRPSKTAVFVWRRRKSALYQRRASPGRHSGVRPPALRAHGGRDLFRFKIRTTHVVTLGSLVHPCFCALLCSSSGRCMAANGEWPPCDWAEDHAA